MDKLIQEMKKTNKLLVLLILQGKAQNECILLLNRVGFSPKEIAELVGATANTVSVALNRAKKKTK